MKLREEKIDDVQVLRIDEPRVDSALSSELKTELLRVIEKEEAKQILIDLKAVEYVDSSGLGSLLFGHRQVKAHDGIIKLVHLNQKVKTLIKIANLEQILVAFDSEKEALESFEIAVRIIRACRELGLASVAVHSEADQKALHVRLADEAYLLGPAPSKESYLQQEKIIAVAKQTGANAIHPGYGFLAENAAFAQKVKDAGLIFIGPPASAIELMGDKTAARQSMEKAGVPIVPGTKDALSNHDEAVAVARKVGYPVLLKASAGGGGKGMRVVKSEKEIAAAFRGARSEAESAFGDGRVYVEKYLEAPRHIEFQVLADMHGNVVHLGERECSIQRRHQKVIEEAPSVVLDEKLRAEMGKAAVNAAKACGYQNAGTIEFMLDKNRNFYFLEMNTRLQVEHPVTELITGLDLVKEQIRIANGEKLGYTQKDIRFSGHAIECRIYAEDSANNFMPSIGKINFMQPASGPGIRDDNGYYQGSEVSMYYDSLISKLVAYGKDREEAIARMKRALGEYLIEGVETSIPFCKLVMQHEKFISGDFDTHFIEKEMSDSLKALNQASIEEEKIAAIAATLFHHSNQSRQLKPTNNKTDKSPKVSNWKIAGRKYI